MEFLSRKLRYEVQKVGARWPHGVAQEILTDNGKVFAGRFGYEGTEFLNGRIFDSHQSAQAELSRQALAEAVQVHRSSVLTG